MARQDWARGFGLLGDDGGLNADAMMFFSDLEERFITAWKTEREATIEALPNLNLSKKDLRRVLAFLSFLPGADLRSARLEGADLVFAQLEGADLGWARLAGADLSWARLEGANLSWARLVGANLIGARLEGANLWQAQLEGADLRRARLQSVEWAGATIGYSPAHSTNLRDARNLTQVMLENVIGDGETKLPVREAPDSPPYYVWSCWEPDNLPPKLDEMLERAAIFETVDELRAKWVCGPDNPRKPTGTPTPLDPN
ncbi:MAG: pentapeptide repeat-containing protein [Rhodobacteraceae bacterium]|nr:pentapeptide repeat-containing protein [Paracoccaceae bacterium]